MAPPSLKKVAAVFCGIHTFILLIGTKYELNLGVNRMSSVRRLKLSEYKPIVSQINPCFLIK